jgi:hypothetical protein
MNYVLIVLTGIVIAVIFNIISKLKIRSIYIFSVIGSFIGSYATDTPTQFSLIPSLVGSLLVVFIVCCSIRV